MSMITRRSNDVFPLATVLDRFFSEPFFSDAPGMIARLDEGTLALDISEDDKDIIVRASLPGFTRENVDIEVHDGVLSIKASKAEETEEKTERYYRKERRTSAVSRRVALPGAVVESQAKAELADGVLTLRLPKIAKEQPKKIKIG